MKEHIEINKPDTDEVQNLTRQLYQQGLQVDHLLGVIERYKKRSSRMTTFLRAQKTWTDKKAEQKDKEIIELKRKLDKPLSGPRQMGRANPLEEK